MDVVMAVLADHKGLAAPFRHNRRPYRFFRLTQVVEVGELSDVVDLHVSRALAELTSIRKESGDQLLGTDRSTWLTVLQDGLLLPSEWYPSVPSDQWLSAAGAFDRCFEARARPVWSIDFGFIFRRCLRYGRAVLACEGLQH